VGVLCIVTTGYLLLEINYIKIAVPVIEIFHRYFSAFIFGLIFERYTRIPRKHSETVYKFSVLLWFKWVFLYGVLYWGFGVGTFGLLCARFMLGISFSNMTVTLPVTIFYVYTLFSIMGFCFGNIMYIALYIGVKYKQTKNRN
jgi:drug/metabolite transporter (DMT)-like permease